MDFQIYESLSTNEQLLLCLHAYIGGSVSTVQYNTLRKKFNLKEEERKEAQKKLLQEELIFREYFFWGNRDNSFRIHPSHYFRALSFLMERHEDWLRIFQAVGFEQDTYFKYLFNLQKILISGKTEALSSFRYENEILLYYLPVAMDKMYFPLMSYFPEALFYDAFTQILVNMQERDIVDTENRLPQLLSEKKLQPMTKIELQEILALYRYFSHGEYTLGENIPNRLYPLMLAGIRALHQTRYVESVDLLTRALKIRNKDSQDKNLFMNFLNCFYLIMAYVHEGSAESRTKIEQFLRKKVVSERTELLPARIIGETYTDQERKIDTYWVKHLLSSGNFAYKKSYRLLGLLFARYFDVNTQSALSLFEENPMPAQAVLRHELSAYLPLSNEERNHLQALYGTAPVLTSIHRKQQWEWVIEDLLKDVQGGENSSSGLMAEKKSSRIMYIIRYSDSLLVREQTILKSGKWSSGKAISGTRYQNGELDFMDDADRKILQTYLHSRHYELRLRDALPHLIGSDRIYTGSFAPFTPVTVDEEKPYLIVEKGKNGFKLNSNIPVKELNNDENSGSIIVKKSDTHYTVIPLSAKQRSYYKRLLSIGSFPLEAETALKSFLPQISQTVEVHSSLVEGGSTLDTLDGSPALSLYVHPNDGWYDMRIYAKPLPEGKALFVPGKGDARIVDEKEETRYQVKRKLRMEKQNYDALADYMEDHLNKTPDEQGIISLYTDELLAVLDYVRQHPDTYYMEWPEGKSMRLKASPEPGRWNVGLKQQGNWFEVEGEVRIDEETVIGMAQLLELIAQSRGNYIRLNDTDYLQLDDALRKQLRKLESLSVKEHGKMQVSSFNAALLDDKLLDGEVKIAHDQALTDLRRRIRESADYAPQVPHTLQATLRPYQEEGFRWMARLNRWGAGACLADDMGLGKTVQTIAYLLLNASEGASLVVAPASVIPNWRNELQRFAPTLNVQVLNEAADRKELIDQAAACDVVLSTYGLLNIEEELLTAKEWNVICLDEAHTIKNRDTKMSHAAMNLKSAHRLILTGTPVQNRLSELWNLFRFINPGLLGSYEQFQRKFINPIEQEDDKERQRQLKRIINPFMLRRTKAEVVEELPDKMEITLPVELTDEEMAVYESIRIKAKAMLEESNAVNVTTLAEITRLRQAACSPQLINEKLTEESSKTRLFLNLVEEIKEGGNRMLVFSQFTSFLQIIRQALDAAGEPYLYLDGSTPMKQREQLVARFQNGECPLFLISLKAGGLGLNLTGANYVIHLDPWWNPAIEQQATDRAYRIGQQRKVTVYHLIAQHTIEEKILRLHHTKRDLADSLLEGTDLSGRVTEKELMEMLTEAY